MENTVTTPQENQSSAQEFVQLADSIYISRVKGGEYKNIVATMANLGDYSLRNQMLITYQNPAATKINNMNAWNYQKRSVKKGEKAIKILAPVFNSVVTSEGGVVSEKKSGYASDYKINSVFDISQIEPKPDCANDKEIENFEPYYDVIGKALQDVLKSYTFKTEDIVHDGILDMRQKTITIKQNLTKEQQFRVVVDQVAAALVFGRDRSKFRGLKTDALPNLMGVETTAVSNIVSRKFGLGGLIAQEPDFNKMTDETIMKFSENLGLIRSVSQLMIKAAENALAETLVREQDPEAGPQAAEKSKATSKPKKAQAAMT